MLVTKRPVASQQPRRSNWRRPVSRHARHSPPARSPRARSDPPRCATPASPIPSATCATSTSASTAGVGFPVNQLALRLVPRRPGDPVWLDDVSSYALQPVSGTVRVTADHMAALFNTVVFARGPGNDPPLRRFAFALDDSTLTMHAEMRRRGAWVSIELRGPVMLRDPQTLVFHPNDVKVRGQDAGPLLDAAHIERADLLPVSTPAVQLIGSEIVMHVPALFPPPAIQLKLTAIRVAHDGLAMQFGDGAPPLPPLANAADARRPAPVHPVPRRRRPLHALNADEHPHRHRGRRSRAAVRLQPVPLPPRGRRARHHSHGRGRYAARRPRPGAGRAIGRRDVPARYFLQTARRIASPSVRGTTASQLGASMVLASTVPCWPSWISALTGRMRSFLQSYTEVRESYW